MKTYTFNDLYARIMSQYGVKRRNMLFQQAQADGATPKKYPDALFRYLISYYQKNPQQNKNFFQAMAAKFQDGAYLVLDQDGNLGSRTFEEYQVKKDQILKTVKSNVSTGGVKDLTEDDKKKITQKYKALLKDAYQLNRSLNLDEIIESMDASGRHDFIVWGGALIGLGLNQKNIKDNKIKANIISTFAHNNITDDTVLENVDVDNVVKLMLQKSDISKSTNAVSKVIISTIKHIDNASIQHFEHPDRQCQVDDDDDKNAVRTFLQTGFGNPSNPANPLCYKVIFQQILKDSATGKHAGISDMSWMDTIPTLNYGVNKRMSREIFGGISKEDITKMRQLMQAEVDKIDAFAQKYNLTSMQNDLRQYCSGTGK